MATLFGTKIQDTYDGLLKVTDNIGITSTKKFITDGLGVNSSVKISSLDFEVANFFFIDVLSGQDPSNYKVGINTSTPTQMLHVVGNMRLTGAFYDSNNATGTSGQILSSTASGTDWVDITAIQTLSGSGTANYLTKWTNTSVLGNSILYETSSKIGIGTIQPYEKLHVDGNVAVDGELHLLSSNEVYGIIKPENSIIKFYAGDGISATGTPDVIITGDGNSRLGVNVASPDEALHVVGDALITGDSQADAFKPAANTEPIKFKNFASTELMRITNTGLVGIANNSPSYTLDVTGTARVSGDTYFVTQGNSDDSNKVATTAYVKNLIEEIPAGLVFQGTWDASTNTPTLTSGSGTTGHFYIVATDGSTNLDGITDWKVGDWAVFVEQGETDQWEKIDNSSVLDGSGTGQKVTLWSGSGTSNTLTDAPITISGNNATFAGTIGSGAITSSASVIASGNSNSFGNTTISALSATSGTFSASVTAAGNSNSFGNTTIAALTATTGVFAGDIASKGLTVDYTGNRTGDAGILVTNDHNDWGIKVDKDPSGDDYGILSQTDGENAIVVRNAAGTNKIQLQGDGDATFAGDISAANANITTTMDVGSFIYVGGNNSIFAENNLRFKSAGAAYIDHNTTGQSLVFRTSNSSSLDTNALTITGAGNATFAGGITVVGNDAQFNHNIILEGSVYHKDDTNTSFGFPADDNIAFTTSGTERMRIDSAGNVQFSGATSNTTVISMNTADGSDTKQLSLAGGGADTDGQGARMRLFGNEHATNGGVVDLSTGNIAGSDMHLRAKDLMLLYTNSSEKMRIDSSGRVGIGTTVPGTKLEVAETTANTDVIVRVKATRDAYLQFAPANTVKWALIADYPALGDFSTYNYPNNFNSIICKSNKDIITNTGGGNFGIGTTNPLNKLTVQASNTGTQATTIPVGKFINTGNSFSKLILGSDNANFDGVISMDNDSTLANTKLRIYIGNGTNSTTGHSNDHIVLQGNGNIGIGTASPQRNLTIYESSGNAVLQLANNTSGVGASDGFLVYTNGVNVGLENKENGYLSLATNASEKMRITSSGRVGIGTTSPVEKLSVSGGNIAVNNSAQLMVGGATGDTKIGKLYNVSGVLSLDGEGNRNIRLGSTTNGEVVRIDNTNERVGIGTTSPNNLLNLQRDEANGDVAIYIQNSNADVGSTNETTSLKFAHGNDGVIGYEAAKIVGGKEGDFESTIANVKGFLSFSTASGTSLTPSINNIERMRIDSAGRVGIGTTTSTAPLDVFGVRAGRNWAINNRANIRLDSNGASNPSDILFGHTSAANQTSWTGVYWALSSRGSSDADKFHFYRGSGNPTVSSEAVLMTLDPNLKVGIGTTTPKSKLQVAGGIQMADDTDTASADKVGTLKYYTSGNNSYVDMCMQTGATTYEWINIVQNNW